MTRNKSPGSKDNVEQRIARLTELSAPGIWDWDRVSGQFVVTPRLRQIFGFKPADQITKEMFISTIHPDDRSVGEFLEVKSQNASEDFSSVRFRIYRADTGQLRWISSRIWQNHETPTSPVTGYSGTLEDVTEEMETASALAESEERLRLAIEAGKMAVWDVDLLSGKMVPSVRLNLLCGYEPDAITNIEDVRRLYNPGELERLARERNTVEEVRERAVGGAFEPRHERMLKTGSERTQLTAEVAITTPAGVLKHLVLRAQYAPSLEGRPRLTGLLIDITEAKMAEERIAVVARELQHRVKNLLSVIGSIAVQTLRGQTDVKAGLSAFQGRLGALAAATDLILERTTSSASLHNLVEKITQPYHNDGVNPFTVEGPRVELQPHATTALGMILHELSTNAVKYGALSVPAGHVEIRWAEQDGNRLALTWEEKNGPHVVAPSRRGFGSRLLDTVVSGLLKGKVRSDFQASGLRCTVEMQKDH